LEKGSETAIPAQWASGDDRATDRGHLVWILPGKTPKGTTRTFGLVIEKGKRAAGATTTKVKEGRHVQVACNHKPIFRFNHGLMSQFPDKPSRFDRACYFHPLWAPCGEVITGDFPRDHLHHRALWFGWVRAKAGPINANFWEIQQGRGKTRNKSITPVQGPVFAGFVARNECISRDKVVLRQSVTAHAYSAPADIRVFDLDVRQEATDADVVLGRIHYGGLGFRGRDEWNGRKARLDILTSEGKTRRDGNATNARWVDYTGPLPNERWGGILIIEHPSNPRYPNRVRIHPSMAFVSTTLVQTGPFTIKKGEPLELRYRLVVHDGKPDKALAERLAADFVSPPKVALKPAK